MTEATKKPSPTETKALKQAYKMLWQNGYEGMSLNELVKKAKISKGGLFHYFPNKKTIVMMTLKTYHETHVLQRLDDHLKSANNAMTLKVALMNWLEDTYSLYQGKEFKEGCMIGNLALEMADHDEDIRETLKSMFVAWENQLVTYLRPAHKEGKMLMEPRQFARLLIAMFQGITMTCKIHRDQNKAARDFQALAEYIERMIMD